MMKETTSPALKTSQFKDKDVKINGITITTNWREIAITSPDNLQDKTDAYKKRDGSNKKEIKATNSNYVVA
jgi:hypothetical protein